MANNEVFRKLDHGLQRGDEVRVGGEWYAVIGYAGDSLFSSKPYGKYEPWLGYRLDKSEVEDCRRPPSSEAA